MANNTTQFTIKINGTEQLVTLDNLINQNATSLGELKDQQNALQQAFDQADYGTAAFDQLQSELRGVNTQLKIIDESVADLTIAEKFEGVGKIASAVGGAFAFASVSVQAFGDENSKTAEQLQKLETQISAVIQGQLALTGIIDAFGSKNKIVAASINSLSKAFNLAGISARGFGLVTRAALISTGIGALLVVVGTLATNFKDLSKLGSGLFKSFQPFFDGIRNFASFVTGGLISNAQTSKLENLFESLAEKNTKIFEEANVKIDDLQKKQTLGLQSTIENSKRILDLNTQAASKSFNALNDTVQEILNLTNVLGTQGGLFPTTSLGVLSAVLTNNLDLLKNNNLSLKERIEIEQDLIVQLETEAVLIKNNNNLTDDQKKLVKEGLLKTAEQINDNLVKRLDLLNKISDEQAKLRDIDIKTNDLNNKSRQTDLDNFKGVLDVIKDIQLQFKTPFQLIDGNAQKLILKELEQLIQNINDEGLQKFFTQNISTQEGFTQGITKLSDELDKLREKERKNVEKTIDSEKLLNNQKRDNLNLFEVQSDQIDANNAATKKLNDLLDLQKTQQLDAIEDKYRSINIELTKSVNSFNDLTNQSNIAVLIKNLDIAKEYIDDFTNGLELGSDNIKLIQDTFANLGVDIKNLNFKENFNLLPINEQSQKLFEFQDKIKEAQIAITNEQLKTTTTTGQENDLKINLLNIVNALIDKYGELIRNNNTLLKSYKEQIKELETQSEILLLQRSLRTAPQTDKQFIQQSEAITKIGELQNKTIQDNFDKETKGLKQTDERYKIALLKRNDLLIQNNDNTIKSLEELGQAYINLIAQSYASIIDSTVKVFDAVFQAQNDKLNRQIEANQIAINNLSEQITAIQEQIGIIDEIINQRKANIDELQQAAESSTAGQREEILKQLDAEVKRTKDLVKEKKALQRQEENAAKAQQKLEKDNQKLALDSIVIQQQAAVVAQVLAIAQTGVAIANIAAASAVKDPTFGIATVAAIIAVTAALTANIIGIASALKNVKQAEANRAALGPAEGGFASDYQPMAKGGYTPMKGNGRDRTGEDAVGTYMLHSNEYVVPRWMVESAKYGSMVHDMEAARKRGFAEGGSPVPLRQINVDANQEINLLLRANLNKPVFVAVTDINDGQSRVNVIENRARF
jgi:hypothetical protein